MSIVIKDTNNKVKIVYSKFTEETRFACNTSVSISNYVVELKLKTGTYTNAKEFLNSFTEELNAVGITDNAKPEFTYTVENDYVTLQCNSKYGFGFCYTPSGISNNIFFQNFPFLLESDFGSANNKNKAQNKITFVLGKAQQNYSLVSTCASGFCQGYSGKIIIKYINGIVGAVGEFSLGSKFITDYIKAINYDAMNVFGIKYNICEFFEATNNKFEIAIMFRDIEKIYIPEALLNQLGFQKNQVSKVNFSTDSTLREQFRGYASYEAYYDCSNFIFNNVLICNMFTMLVGNIIIDNVSYIQNNGVIPKNPYCILTKIAKLVTGYTGVNPVGEITQASVLESTLMFTRDLSSRINYSIDSLTTDYYSFVFIKDSSQKGLKITIYNYYNKPCVDPDNIFAPTIVGQVSTAPCSNCMAGTMSRTCNNNYTFSEVDRSTCTVQYCQKEDLNGEIWSKTAAGETASVSCPTNYKGRVYRTCDCSTVEWGVPDDSNCVRAECPANGEFPKTYAGETVTLNCANNQTGKIKRLCKSDGTWGSIDNTCEDIYCSASDNFPKTLGGTTATLNCAANQSGNITRSCNNDGTWGSIDNTCEDNYCPANDGFPKTLGGSTATLNCAANQDGSITRFCNNDGTWSSAVNKCAINYCPAEGLYSKTLGGTTATLDCADNQSGSITRPCKNDGKWGTEVNTCEDNYCPANNGFPKTLGGTTAKMSCADNQKGEITRFCQNSGTWGEINNNCVNNYCPAEFSYERTLGGTTVTRSCANNQSGSITRFCNNDGTWETEVNTCKDNYCPANNGFPKTLGGTTATLGCAVNQSGSITRSCKNDGTWASIDNTCEDNYCPTDNEFPKTLGGTTATLGCAVNQSGSITRHCKNDGTWGTEVNTCKDNYCPANNGFPKTLGGTTASISCGDNYSGSITRLCKNDGTWDSPSISNCSLTICKAESGFEDTPLGFTATKPCESGYRGQLTRLCNSDGSWGPVEGSCEEIITKCTADPALGFNETPLGEIAYKTCDSPIQDGRVSRQCNMDGSWGPVVSTCVDRYCPAVGNFPRTIASSNAYLDCPQGYNGTGISKYCKISGVWDETLESCTRIICSADQGFDDTYAGETAVKPCESGYTGNYTRSCDITGSWGPITNNCTQVPYCSEDNYKGFTWPKTEVGKTVELTCPNDSKVKVTRTCLENQKWGETTPETIPRTCINEGDSGSSENNNLLIYIIIGIVAVIAIIIIIVIIRRRRR